ncbi:MAG: UDP-N-acetylmuramoyl-L-alanyl-D-glutamate--2,6-diaminopimelate ligase [Candidatus Dependentiae bacterium]|nr:UDP-N-acetylmuramoyl-L-alanyl-D-glutamate--2,6-diaminopimelate ligase [Candidatus Dependentiae bacterium]
MKNNFILMPAKFPVTCHTDFIEQGSIFVAIKGYKQDGARYIPTAIEKGATTIIVDQTTLIPFETEQEIIRKNITVRRVNNTRHALAILSAQAAGYPADQLCIIGITGTKGKTTTSFLLEHIIRSAGHKTALLSTVYNKIGDAVFQAPLTTAQPDYLHQFLKLCVENNVRYVVMEVAAQALSMHRVAGIFFDGLIFTNFSQEHGEFYSSLEQYFQAKCSILDHAKPNIPIILNHDDIWCSRLLNKYPKLTTFGRENGSSYQLNIMQETPYLQVQLQHQNNELVVQTPSLIGIFNGYNIAAATAMSIELGINNQTIIDALLNFDNVPGRMQRYHLPNGALGIIDYAHNPSSFEQLFSCFKRITPHLIVVFGAGGERAHDKRSVMGTIAAQYADHIVLTSDNPRSEDPAAIVQDILQGITEDKRSKVVIELDREKAIETAYQLSRKNSIIALLGKGPEEYQLIKGVKQYFSEAKILQSVGTKFF